MKELARHAKLAKPQKRVVVKKIQRNKLQNNKKPCASAGFFIHIKINDLSNRAGKPLISGILGIGKKYKV